MQVVIAHPYHSRSLQSFTHTIYTDCNNPTKWSMLPVIAQIACKQMTQAACNGSNRWFIQPVIVEPYNSYTQSSIVQSDVLNRLKLIYRMINATGNRWTRWSIQPVIVQSDYLHTLQWIYQMVYATSRCIKPVIVQSVCLCGLQLVI